MYKHIIFDFGGVFLYLGKKNNENHGYHFYLVNEFSKKYGVPRGKIAKMFEAHHNRLHTGRETPKQFLALVDKRFNKNLDVNAVHLEWKKRHRLRKEEINWKLVRYMQHLKKRYKVHMFSNAIDLNYTPDPKWLLRLQGNFDSIFMSYKEKIKKPDRSAFIYVLKKIKAKPEECIFVDDLRQNVAAANKIGIKSFLFVNVDKLKSDMAKENII
jgi:putative hydrolase of the HAD superfamily